jgi:hypothetical protein
MILYLKQTLLTAIETVHFYPIPLYSHRIVDTAKHNFMEFSSQKLLYILHVSLLLHKKLSIETIISCREISKI